MAREVREETGLCVDAVEFLFSIPNIYPYGGLDIHTIDMFYLCHVKSAENAKPADDAAEIMWIPWEEIKPETFGLTSIRKGVQQLLAKKIHNI